MILVGIVLLCYVVGVFLSSFVITALLYYRVRKAHYARYFEEARETGRYVKLPRPSVHERRYFWLATEQRVLAWYDAHPIVCIVFFPVAYILALFQK